MVLMNFVAFVVFKILRNLVSFYILSEYVINFVSNLVFLAVENVVSFT